MWYRWTSIESFDAWHDAVCATLGIPHPGRNAATGELDTSAQWTTAYVEPAILSDDDIRCFIPDFFADAEESGAIVCEPPPEPMRSSVARYA